MWRKKETPIQGLVELGYTRSRLSTRVWKREAWTFSLMESLQRELESEMRIHAQRVLSDMGYWSNGSGWCDPSGNVQGTGTYHTDSGGVYAAIMILVGAPKHVLGTTFRRGTTLFTTEPWHVYIADGKLEHRTNGTRGTGRFLARITLTGQRYVHGYV